jgi:hypothetical protein
MMRDIRIAALAAAFLCLSGCATYRVGKLDTATMLKRFEPIPGKASVYVCRVPAVLVARGVKTEVYIDNQNIGTLKQNSFVHTEVEPGKHGVLLRHDGMNKGTGGFETFDVNAGDVRFFWVGVTGHGWGVLTVDNFDSEADARKCVTEAEYSVAP